MTSAHCNGPSARTSFAARALAIWAVASVAWAMCLPGPLWAQTPQFQPCGTTNICASPTTAYVGIGTSTVARILTIGSQQAASVQNTQGISVTPNTGNNVEVTVRGGMV